MIKKIYISESEKDKILSQYNILNEATGLSIGGVVKDLETDESVFDAKITLTKGGSTKGLAKTKDDGSFKFEGLDSGDYIIRAENSTQGYSATTKEVTLSTTDSLDNVILLPKNIKEYQEVVVSSKKVTILDFNFVDDLGNPLSNVSYTLFKDKKNILGDFTSSNGKDSLVYTPQDILVKGNEPITYDKNKKDGFFYTEVSGACRDNKDLFIVAKVKGYLETKQNINFCLNNGAYNAQIITKDNMQTATPSDNALGVPNKTEKFATSNVFNITLTKPEIYLKILTKDNEDSVLSNVKIDIYKDKDRQSLLQAIETNQNGFGNVTLTVGDIELFNDEDETVKKVKLYFYVRRDGYKELFGSKNIKYGKEDEIVFNLDKIKPPKPPKIKEITIGQCRRFTRKYHRGLVSLIKKKKTIDELGGNSAIEEARTQVEWCFLKYKDGYSNNMRKLITKLTNVPPKFDIFELRFTLEQQRDIYKESKDMGISQTIKKVISEQSEKKSLLIKESKIIKNRLLFVYNSSNRRTLKNNLLDESTELVNSGYDKRLVKENFLEIMNTVKDSGKFLSDVKSQLGQKIADTVKDKQQEHEMILSAFNELDPAIVERAFKENRVDELSEIISKKALENYKTQFGETGIFGSMVASVDTEKFKSEVAKLIQTSIDAVSGELDSKVQDAVTEE